MVEVPLYNYRGEASGTVSLSPSVFGAEVNQPLLHQVVSVQLANQHQGTASTLTRGEVSRSGHKPWRQKGTGRARQGTRSAPHWVGGGVVFGPMPGKVEKYVPRKMRRKALVNALSVKVADESLHVVESLDLPAGKTRDMVAVLQTMGLKDKKVLIVLDVENPQVRQASANIPQTRTQLLQQTSVVDLMKYDHVVITRAAVNDLERRLGV